MLKYISWIVLLFVVAISMAIFKKYASTTTNCEFNCLGLKRKLQSFARFFSASLLAVCMVFLNFGFIRSYLFSILPEQTIASAYALIKVLFGVPSVTYALNSLCVYFVIGSSISALCFFSINILTQTLIIHSTNKNGTTENEYKFVNKHSFYNKVSFISLRKLRI